MSAALLHRKLTPLPKAGRVALELAVRGHLGAGRQLASATWRAWLPFALPAALVSRRARRVLIAAGIVPALVEWRSQRPPLDPLRWTALHLADDAAYCVGVWRGCIRERTTEPLCPHLSAPPTNPAPPTDARTGRRMR